MIFHFDSVAGVKSQALTSLQKLKVSIHSALTDFESNNPFIRFQLKLKLNTAPIDR